MPNYIEAGDELSPYVERIMGRYHRGLADAGVTVGCLFAHAKRDENGAAINEYGVES